MDASLKQVAALLEGDEKPLRVAAAQVLRALAPRDSTVVQALVAGLDREDRRFRVHVLRALAAIGDAAAFDAVVPLLDDEGEVGRAAVDALAGMGAPVLKKLKTRFAKSGDTAQRRMLAVAATLGGADGMDLIVRALQAGHAELVLAFADRRADELAALKPREKTAFKTRISKFLGSPAAAKNAAAAGAAVDVLGRVLGTDAATELLGYAKKRQSPFVRRRALEGLARLAEQVALAPGHLTEILGYVTESDYTNVVAPAMGVLERVRLSSDHLKPLLGFLKGQDPALRRFAVSALGQIDTETSASALVDVVKGDNPDLQKRAAKSLERQKSAVAPVADALASARDANTAWVLARILEPRAHHLKPPQVEKLAKAGAAWLEPGDPRAEAVVSILRGRYLAQLAEAGLRRVKRLKRGRKAGEIVNLLRPLFRDGREAPLEIRYELALAELVRGRKDVVREARLHNAGLRGLEPLLADDEFGLPTRLKREKSVLTPEEYYLIGSHFAERTFSDRSFGGELLRWLVKTFPEDQSSSAATNKLVMEGFPPPRTPAKRTKRKPAAAKKAAPAAKKKKAPAKKKKAPAKKKAPVKKKAPAKKKKTARKTKKR